MASIEETERALLGCLIIDASILEQIEGKVCADDFSRKQHGVVFGTIHDMHSRGIPPDQHSLANELERKGLMNTVVMVSGFLHLGPPSLAPHHAVQIAAAAKRRRISAEATALGELCLSGEDEQIYGSIARLAELLDVGTEKIAYTLSEACDRYIGFLRQLEGDKKTRPKWETGMILFDEDVNEGLGGCLQGGQLMIACGRAGAGKTTIALFLVKELMKHNPELKAYFFSLELSGPALGGKLVRSEMVHKPERYVKGTGAEMFISNAERGAKKIRESYGDRVSIIDHTGMSPGEILSQARRACKEGCKVVVIDHLHRISYPRSSELRHEICDFCKHLTDIAKDYGALFVVCAQLNRDSQKDGGRAPTTADISESGQIEQHADIVMSIHREKKSPGRVILSLIKNRHGPEVSRPFNVTWTHQRFEELEG